MGPNNISRRFVTMFAKLNGMEKHAHKNLLIYGNKLIPMSITPAHKERAEIRQLYHGSELFWSYWLRSKKVYEIPSSQFHVDRRANRRDPDNISAHTAKALFPFSNYKVVNCCIPKISTDESEPERPFKTLPQRRLRLKYLGDGKRQVIVSTPKCDKDNGEF